MASVEDAKTESQRMDASRRIHESIRPSIKWEKKAASAIRFRPVSRKCFGFVRPNAMGADSFFVLGGACKTEEQAMEVPVLRGDGKNYGWECAKNAMPVAAFGHAAVVVNSRRIVVFGGIQAGDFSSAVYVLDPGTMTWSEPARQGDWPEARRDMAFCCVQRKLLIHGGYRQQVSLETEESPPEKGKEAKQKAESKRERTSSEGTKRGDQGAPMTETISLDDLWSADVGSRGITWHRLPSRKHALYGHSAVAWEDRVVFFGGVETPSSKDTAAISSLSKEVSATIKCVNTIHVLAHLGSASWLDVENEGPKAAIPKARAYHSATVVDQYMIIYGGYDTSNQLLQDVCTLHLPSMTWTKPQLTSPLTEVPQGRAFHGAALRGFNEIFIFGGTTEDPTKGSDDVYSLTVTPPPAQIPQEIFQDMLSSLLERVQRTVDALATDYGRETSALQIRVNIAEDGLTNAELTNRGLNEQMTHLRDQRDRFEERITKQQEQLMEMEGRADVVKKQAGDTVARTELELQRLQRKVRKLLGPQSGSAATISSEDLKIQLSDESQVSDYQTVLAPHRLSPGIWGQAQVGCETLLGVSLDARWEEALNIETRVLQQLRHPHLIESYGAVAHRDGLVFLQEPVFETWFDFLMEDTTDPEKVSVALEIATALDFLHARGVAHTNVSLESVFIKSADPLSVALGRLVSSRITCRVHRVAVVPSKYHLTVPDLQSARRTKHEDFDPRCEDIAALGSLLTAIFIQQEVSASQRVAQIDRIKNRSIQMMVMACLDKDPRHRPSARMMVTALAQLRDGEVPQLQRMPDDPTVNSPLVDIDIDAE
jgi:hypothetical protein